MLNRFHSDPRQVEEFERAVAVLASLAPAGAGGAEQWRAPWMAGLIAEVLHGRFQVPFAMGAGAARGVMQRYAITFGGTAEEYEQQAEELRRYLDQRYDGAQQRLERRENPTP